MRQEELKNSKCYKRKKNNRNINENKKKNKKIKETSISIF